MRPIFGAIMAFRLVSNAFTNNDLIPVKFTADGDDTSPQLSWSDPPANTVSFALVLEDRNAKPGKIHWVLWDLPATRHALPAKIASDPVLPDGTCQGLNGFNKVGYSGPRLSQVTEHKYEFTLYALDSKLGLKAGSNHAELKAVMGGHIIAQTQLAGRYKPQRDDARLRALENDKESPPKSCGESRRAGHGGFANMLSLRKRGRVYWLEGRIGNRRIQTTLGTRNHDAAAIAKNRIERAFAEGATSEEWPCLRTLIPETVFSNLAAIIGYTEQPHARPHTWTDLKAAFTAEAGRRIALGKLRGSTWTRYQYTLSEFTQFLSTGNVTELAQLNRVEVENSKHGVSRGSDRNATAVKQGA